MGPAPARPGPNTRWWRVRGLLQGRAPAYNTMYMSGVRMTRSPAAGKHG